jgi:hypothetical protein
MYLLGEGAALNLTYGDNFGFFGFFGFDTLVSTDFCDFVFGVLVVFT